MTSNLSLARLLPLAVVFWPLLSSCGRPPVQEAGHENEKPLGAVVILLDTVRSDRSNHNSRSCNSQFHSSNLLPNHSRLVYFRRTGRPRVGGEEFSPDETHFRE